MHSPRTARQPCAASSTQHRATTPPRIHQATSRTHPPPLCDTHARAYHTVPPRVGSRLCARALSLDAERTMPTRGCRYMMCTASLAALTCLAAGVAQPLPPLSIDPAGITISGISSGADFVVNLHVAHSSIISGVGVFAGQACAFGLLDTLLYGSQSDNCCAVLCKRRPLRSHTLSTRRNGSAKQQRTYLRRLPFQQNITI